MCAPAIPFSAAPMHSELSRYNDAMFDYMEALDGKYPLKPAADQGMIEYLVKHGVIEQLFGGPAITRHGRRILAPAQAAADDIAGRVIQRRRAYQGPASPK